jgi:hypothetical protein
MSVAHLGLDTMREMIQQSRCPNLYWALSDLPCPLVDVHTPMQGERIRVASEWRTLRGDSPMSEDDLDALVGRLSGVMNLARVQAGLPPGDLRRGLRERIADRTGLDAARRRLVDAGASRESMDQLPPMQVVLLDERRAFGLLRDERLKLLGVPVWRLDGLSEDEATSRDGLLSDLLPDVAKLRRTQGALEQEVALLRHVEALRMYAAGHDGKLPSALSDIPVPMPVDPITGRPFEYAAEGQAAHLRGGDARGDVSHAHTGLTYVIQLVK